MNAPTLGSLYMSQNHQNLTLTNCTVNIDNRIVKIQLTTGLGNNSVLRACVIPEEENSTMPTNLAEKQNHQEKRLCVCARVGTRRENHMQLPHLRQGVHDRQGFGPAQETGAQDSGTSREAEQEGAGEGDH